MVIRSLKRKPATPESDQLSCILLLAKLLCDTPGGTRTPSLLVRSQTLYPIELRAQEGEAMLCRPGSLHKSAPRNREDSRGVEGSVSKRIAKSES